MRVLEESVAGEGLALDWDDKGRGMDRFEEERLQGGQHL